MSAAMWLVLATFAVPPIIFLCIPILTSSLVGYQDNDTLKTFDDMDSISSNGGVNDAGSISKDFTNSTEESTTCVDEPDLPTIIIQERHDDSMENSDTMVSLEEDNV